MRILLMLLLVTTMCNAQKMENGLHVYAGLSTDDSFKGSLQAGIAGNIHRVMIASNVYTEGRQDLRIGYIFGDEYKLVPYVSYNHTLVMYDKYNTYMYGPGGGVIFNIPINISKYSVNVDMSGNYINKTLTSYMGVCLKYRLTNVYCD